MPEARDRIERPDDYAVAFLNRRQNNVLLDEPALRLRLIETPVQRLPVATAGNTVFRAIGQGSIVHRGRFVRRLGNGRGQSPFRLPQGRENTPVAAAQRRRGRSLTGVSPSWHQRTPLRDITVVERGIVRRNRTGEVDGGEIETLTPQLIRVLDSPVQLSSAWLERNRSMVTPAPAVGSKRSHSTSTAKVHKMLLDITKENYGETEFATPQKKLFNSIDKVEKVVMEEIQKLKCTPLAKREEREKRVRTLQSMR